MTRSKLDLATILVKLRGDGSDPEVLAKELTLMKLCHEIQKLEEERELEAEKAETPDAPAETVDQPVEPLTKKEEQMLEEIKAPAEANTKAKKEKHILSWLLDSSDDD
jgi:hypothetical protein